MKVAIIGSRSFNEYSIVKDFIDRWKNYYKITIDNIISGGAKGADTLGEQYANEYNIPIIKFLPDWNKYGKSAGFRRNKDIIENCDVCFAFWDGESHGTKNDLDLCKQYNKECYIYNKQLNKFYKLS